MSPESLVAIVGGLLVAVSVAFIIIRKLPKRIKKVHYTRKWREIQRLCADKASWSKAILESDELLGEVLQKKRKEGKTIGERMVAAQKDFTSNDSIWNAHKLANHIKTHDNASLKESDIKEALVAYRQALRDLGAL